MKELKMDGNELRKLSQTPKGSEIVRKSTRTNRYSFEKKIIVKNKNLVLVTKRNVKKGQICGTYKPDSISGGTDYYGLKIQNAVFPELNFSKHIKGFSKYS